MKAKSLISKIGNAPLRVKDLARIGVSRNELNRLLADNTLLRLGRGVYQHASSDLNDENLFRSATLRIRGPSAVCLISALAHYNLTDEIPKKTWLLVDVNSRSYHKDIRLFRSHHPHWKIGIVNSEGYRITNIERTIVDCLVYQARIGSIGIEGLKRALREKRTTLAKIVQMADKLQVSHRILQYVQVLS